MTQMSYGLIKPLLNKFCELNEVDIDTIRGKSLSNGLPQLRYIFCYCIRRTFPDLTLIEISSLVNRDFSTISLGISKLENRINGLRDDVVTKARVVSFLSVCKSYRLQLLDQQKEEPKKSYPPTSKKWYSLSGYFARFVKWIRS